MNRTRVKKTVETEAEPELDVHTQDSADVDDGDLVSRCQGGDMSAFELLMDRYEDRVFNLAQRMVGHHQEAQDITQEVFLRALEHIGTFRQQAQLYTWLFRIAVNLSISRRRRGQRVRFVSLDAATGGKPEDDGEVLSRQLPNTRSEQPQDAALRNERTEQVVAAIDKLDDEFRAVLVLKDIEGFDYQEIADILELPLGTVKSRLHRARVDLKERLKPMFQT